MTSVYSTKTIYRAGIQGFSRGLHAFSLMVVFAAALLPGAAAWGAGGDLLWENQFDAGGGFNQAFALTTRGSRVFAAGFGVTQAPDFKAQWVVRAYRGKKGELLWQDQFDKGGGFNQALSLSAKGSRVFAAGFGLTCDDPPDCNAGRTEWVVRAYDTKTGQLLWDDQFDKGGGLNQADAIAAKGSRVFAGGRGLTCGDSPDCNAGRTEWVVRAYDAKTGQLLWDDQFDGGGKVNTALAVAVKGSRVFATGAGTRPDATEEWVVRAYDTRTGQLLWDDRFDKGGGANQANAVAVKGSRVFAAGQGSTPTGEQEWVIRAYDKKTGELLWHDQFDKGGALSRADTIAVKGANVVAAGSGLTCDDPPDCHSGRTEWVVRAYDARTGQFLWDEQFDVGGGFNRAEAIAVKGSRVFAAGFGSNTDSQDEWLVRTYAVKTGEVLWADEFDSSGTTRFFSNRAGAVAVKGSRVFAAGRGAACEDLPACNKVTTQWLLRAYDTR